MLSTRVHLRPLRDGPHPRPAAALHRTSTRKRRSCGGPSAERTRIPVRWQMLPLAPLLQPRFRVEPRDQPPISPQPEVALHKAEGRLVPPSRKIAPMTASTASPAIFRVTPAPSGARKDRSAATRDADPLRPFTRFRLLMIEARALVKHAPPPAAASVTSPARRRGSAPRPRGTRAARTTASLPPARGGAVPQRLLQQVLARTGIRSFLERGKRQTAFPPDGPPRTGRCVRGSGPPARRSKSGRRLGVILRGPAHLPVSGPSPTPRRPASCPTCLPRYSPRIAASAARRRANPPRLLRRDHVRPSIRRSRFRAGGVRKGVEVAQRVVADQPHRPSKSRRLPRKPGDHVGSQSDPRDLGGEQNQSLTILPRRIRRRILRRIRSEPTCMERAGAGRGGPARQGGTRARTRSPGSRPTQAGTGTRRSPGGAPRRAPRARPGRRGRPPYRPTWIPVQRSPGAVLFPADRALDDPPPRQRAAGSPRPSHDAVGARRVAPVLTFRNTRLCPSSRSAANRTTPRRPKGRPPDGSGAVRQAVRLAIRSNGRPRHGRAGSGVVSASIRSSRDPPDARGAAGAPAPGNPGRPGG